MTSTAGARRGGLDIAGIAKSFGSAKALDGIDLAVPAGEFLALLGPSGCGKTTLLRCIAGLVEADAGSISVDSRSLAGLQPWKRDVGVVFQSYALFPHMNVAENIAFGLRMRRLPRAEIARLVEEVIALVRLEGLGGRMPSQLSGGQQQRVALARAIVIEPTLLLLDEPLAALDARLRASVQIEIRQLQARLGLTTVLVTHDQTEAMTMAHRIAVMNEGRIEQIAGPAEIYARPATPFVAEFIGEMNRVPVRLNTQDGGARSLVAPSPDIRLAAPEANLRPRLQSKAVLMVRPEAIRIVAPEGTSERDSVALAVVDDVLVIGDRCIVLASSGPVKLRVSLPRQTGQAVTLPALGQPVTLTWAADDSLIFPR